MPMIHHIPLPTHSTHLNTHPLPILLRPLDRLPRLLNLLEHRVEAHLVGVDVCGLGFEVDGVGGEAWVVLLVGGAYCGEGVGRRALGRWEGAGGDGKVGESGAGQRRRR